MLECYRKQMLRVNLTDRTFEVSPVSDEFLSEYVGGMGWGVKVIGEEVPPTAEALGPKNKLFISAGPLTATHAPMHAQTCIVSKSPLTGGIINCYCGGYMGGAIKTTPYDFFVIEGVADELMYLLITPEGVSFVSCPELAGLNTEKAEKVVRETSGYPDTQVMSIGLGGENRVRFAAVMSGTRAFGRGGLGAVFGSKNLKAIGIFGQEDVHVSDPEAYDTAVRAMRKDVDAAVADQWNILSMFSKDGTGFGMSFNSEKHAMATMNHLKCQFDGATEIDGKAYISKYPTRAIACPGCPVHCGMLRTMNKPTRFGDVWGRGPEYETMYSLGSMCNNADSDALLRANLVCEEYGMDTLSSGVTVAFAMECAMRGVISVDALGEDIPLEFGNGDAVVRLLEMIGRREGLGNILAEGTKRASKKLVKGSEVYALNSKGMEFAAWMPERMRGIALSFATSNRGACHKRAIIGDEMFRLPMDSVEEKPLLTKEIQDKVNAMFTLVSCRFAEMGIPLEHFSNMLSSATGISRDPDWLMRLGDKLWNMERVYNMKSGLAAEDDWLPERCFEPLEGLPEDAIPFSREILRDMIQEYYQVRGWDKSGTPTVEKLESLGIDPDWPSA
ncbi:MAG: aldehyde ferredoxin oxidoreductase family protein [Anaerolineae bacterium]|nr:aldehyde ferredoxin oxidoreductase family protein [Anaerolineae bacterium]